MPWGDTGASIDGLLAWRSIFRKEGRLKAELQTGSFEFPTQMTMNIRRSMQEFHGRKSSKLRDDHATANTQIRGRTALGIGRRNKMKRTIALAIPWFLLCMPASALVGDAPTAEWTIRRPAVM